MENNPEKSRKFHKNWKNPRNSRKRDEHLRKIPGKWNEAKIKGSLTLRIKTHFKTTMKTQGFS